MTHEHKSDIGHFCRMNNSNGKHGKVDTSVVDPICAWACIKTLH